MSTITWPEEIPDGAWGVQHAGCGQAFPARTEEDLDALGEGSGKLVCRACEEQQSGTGYGFVAVKRPSIADQLPEVLATDFTPVPRALWDHGHLLGLTAKERLVICAIWRHGAGGRAFPSHKRLALETGLGERTITRTVATLEDPARPALLTVWRERRAGRHQANEYDLGPLWEALAAVVASTAGQSGPRRAEEAVLPEETRRSDTTAGQDGPRPQATLAPGPQATLAPQEEQGEEEPAEEDPTDVGSAAADAATDERRYDVLNDDGLGDLSPDAEKQLLRMRQRRAVRRGASA